MDRWISKDAVYPYFVKFWISKPKIKRGEYTHDFFNNTCACTILPSEYMDLFGKDTLPKAGKCIQVTFE